MKRKQAVKRTAPFTLKPFRVRSRSPLTVRETEAQKEWKEWYEAEINELRDGDVPDGLNAHRAKLADKTLTGLALICECCDTPEPRAVGLTAIKRAIRFTEILKTHAARLFKPYLSIWTI
ncbi:MAG: DUF3987 domain-containing protein [Opitutales bacterium]